MHDVDLTQLISFQIPKPALNASFIHCICVCAFFFFLYFIDFMIIEAINVLIN